MKEKDQGVWIGEMDLTNDPGFIEISGKEFASLPEALGNAEAVEQIEGNRRDFLKMLGFGLGAATIAAGCDIPVKRAIPYVVKPDAIVPGVATYYATSFVNGGDYASILVKTREGRPIKVEGNDLAGFGGTSARAQASVLNLYDTARFRNPQMNDGSGFIDASWEDIDKAAMDALTASGSIRLVSSSIYSPSKQRAIDAFVAKYPSTKHVQYDPVSYAALLDANEEDFGDRVMPAYHFDKADVVVSFDADFIGTWGDYTRNAANFIKNRKIDHVKGAKMSRLYQVESHMSLTGSNADNRVLVKPSEQGAAIVTLYNYVTGGNLVAPSLNDDAKKALQNVAKDLKSAAGRSIVVCGTNNKAEQSIVNALNDFLGNIGTTVDFAHANLTRKGSDTAVGQLINDMNNGSVDTVIFMDANPAYDFKAAGKMTTALAKVKNKFSLAYSNDETTDMCSLVAPINHYLESWGDVNPSRGTYSLMQPTISPLFDTRQAEETLLAWAGESYGDSYMDYVAKTWESDVFANQSSFGNFSRFWEKSLHDGVAMMDVPGVAASYSGNPSSAASNVTKTVSGEGIEIKLYEPTNLDHLAIPVDFNGVSKMVSMNNLKDGDLVTLQVNGESYTVPVVQQFGQAPGTVALALGYGKEVSGLCGQGVGVNMNNNVTVDGNGYRTYGAANVEVSSKTGEDETFASVQYHHTYGVKDTDKATGELINADEAALVTFSYGMGVQGYQGALTDRSVMYYSNLDELAESVAHLDEKRSHAQHLNEQQIYGGHDALYKQGHHWGMHVDLNSCTGCSACTVACMAENNVPVVGKREVSRHHEMTWLRIDRYYYGKLENPNTVYQPMMCQHCDNAPCENVCPVNATNHSSEGLNQMTYNRCVGTRYCANNCPYKVRRFNWLDYTTADTFPGNQPTLNGEEQPYGSDNLTRMVLNPDVTVRSRGVIEKCSFCVQRIQEGKLTAKSEMRSLRDSDVKTACQTACPTGAITFGDMNNKKGNLSHKLENPLNFIVLEEVNVRSSVQYSMRVNNRNNEIEA